MEFKEIGRPGFRYRTDFERSAGQIIEGYRELMDRTGCLTGNVGDTLGRSAAMDSRIKALSPGMKVVGPALTVRVPPDDNLMIHKALTLIQPGDVMVIDAGGNRSRASLGSIMVRIAMKHGAEGIVIDGSVRDAREISELEFPVFAAGVSPNGPFKQGPGEINFPVHCGGLIVYPGDLVIGDDDGVVVVKRELASQENIAQVKDIISKEEKRIKEIESGATIRPDLIETLREKGLMLP